MSAFKEQLKQDMAVFLNLDELAETHKIQGIPVTVVIDNDELMQRSDKVGISLGEILIFIQDDEWRKVQGSHPTQGQDLSFDGKHFIVQEWNIDDGLYEIVLGQNRST